MKKSAYLKTAIQKLLLQSMKPGIIAFSLIFCSLVTLAQNITVRGKVVKSDDQPVVGATKINATNNSFSYVLPSKSIVTSIEQ